MFLSRSFPQRGKQVTAVLLNKAAQIKFLLTGFKGDLANEMTNTDCVKSGKNVLNPFLPLKPYGCVTYYT